MDHEIHLSLQSGLQGPFVVRQEIMPSSPTFDPRLRRQVEAQMGVGQEEEADGCGHTGHGYW
jgi:hypothetical protein